MIDQISIFNIYMERGESPVKTFLRYFLIFSIGFSILQDFSALISTNTIS